LDGGTPISREVASYLLEIDSAAAQISLIDRLTPRERDMVDLSRGRQMDNE
jgi:hypothetical protein